MSEAELQKKISRLKAYMDDFSVYIIFQIQNILEDKEKIYTMERLFQLIVDEAIDINTIVAYSRGVSITDSYKSTFFTLADLGVISQELAEQISPSAGLRNKIVHDYEKLQKHILIEAMKTFFVYYKTYLQSVTKIIK